MRRQRLHAVEEFVERQICKVCNLEPVLVCGEFLTCNSLEFLISFRRSANHKQVLGIWMKIKCQVNSFSVSICLNNAGHSGSRCKYLWRRTFSCEKNNGKIWEQISAIFQQKVHCRVWSSNYNIDVHALAFLDQI